MNAEYYRELLNALAEQGADLSKVTLRCDARNNGMILCLPSTGTTVINIDKDSNGEITIEFR